jgi:hypothetical protein
MKFLSNIIHKCANSISVCILQHKVEALESDLLELTKEISTLETMFEETNQMVKILSDEVYKLRNQK